MIKNIVFDMGNVLVAHNGMWTCEQFILDETERKEVFQSVFVSPEWVMLDMGVISEEQAIINMCARIPEHLHDAVKSCMAHWHEYSMKTLADMEPVIRSLKKSGLGIYLCSNANVRLLQCYQDYIPAVECFDGILFSCEVKCMKPQMEMYQHFFQCFHLLPEECFFIDDLQLNIDGAKACGMDGYCFKNHDVSELWTALEKATKL